MNSSKVTSANGRETILTFNNVIQTKRTAIGQMNEEFVIFNGFIQFAWIDNNMNSL